MGGVVGKVHDSSIGWQTSTNRKRNSCSTIKKKQKKQTSTKKKQNLCSNIVLSGYKKCRRRCVCVCVWCARAYSCVCERFPRGPCMCAHPCTCIYVLFYFIILCTRISARMFITHDPHTRARTHCERVHSFPRKMPVASCVEVLAALALLAHTHTHTHTHTHHSCARTRSRTHVRLAAWGTGAGKKSQVRGRDRTFNRRVSPGGYRRSRRRVARRGPFILRQHPRVSSCGRAAQGGGTQTPTNQVRPYLLLERHCELPLGQSPNNIGVPPARHSAFDRHSPTAWGFGGVIWRAR